MYRRHFGLERLPFQNTPDPDFFFMGRCYRQALAALVHGVTTRKGLMCISGPIGSGKTTLARVMLDRLPGKAKVLSIQEAGVQPQELFMALAEVLDIPVHPGSHTQLQLSTAIRSSLVRLNEAQGFCVLIIDEAQLIVPELWPGLLTLSNIETSQDKLVQILLLGQKELVETLEQPQMRQLYQRISVAKTLAPMTREESVQYIAHRLSVAGGHISLFNREALPEIYAYTYGLPRLINRICDGALLQGFVDRTKTVAAEAVIMAAREIGIGASAVRTQAPASRVGGGPKTARKTSAQTQPANSGSHSRPGAPAPPLAQRLQAARRRSGQPPPRSMNWLWGLIILVLALCGAVAVILQEQPTGQKRTGAFIGDRPSVIRKKIDVLSAPDPAEAGIQIRSKGDSAITGSADAAASRVPKQETAPANSVLTPAAGQAVTRRAKMNYVYSLQLASVRTRGQAEQVIDLYAAIGVRPHWVGVDLGSKGLWYRVFAGHFNTLDYARQRKAELALDDAVVHRIGHALLIATHTSSSTVSVVLEELRRKGYSPFVVEGPPDSHLVYAGHFFQPEPAQQQCDRLITQGFSCQLVSP